MDRHSRMRSCWKPSTVLILNATISNYSQQKAQSDTHTLTAARSQENAILIDAEQGGK